MLKRFAVVIVLLLLVFGGIAYLKMQQYQGMMQELSQPQPPAVVAATEVREETWQPLLRSVGSLVAASGIDVATEVAGKVSAIHFRSGSEVEAGAPLVQLDDTVDRANLEGLRADRRLAQVQLGRAADLFQRKVISKSEYDEAQARYDAAAARVKEQEALIAKKRITAPFAGLAGIRRVDIGEYLSPGGAVVRLRAVTPIFVDYSLPERHFAALAEGQRVEIEVDAYPGEVFTGEVSAIDAGLEEGTRSLWVRATLENRDGRLRSGMFARVRTLQSEQQQVRTVPRTAISYNTYGDFVYVIATDEEGQQVVRRRQVETGSVREGRVAIRHGLEAGEQVVRAGLVKLRDGQSVKIDNSVELHDAEVNKE